MGIGWVKIALSVRAIRSTLVIQPGIALAFSCSAFFWNAPSW